MAARPRLATVWLGGCSGCHMSLLDLDERLAALLGRVDLVYSPLADVKRYPEGVDLALVEGAVANEDHLAVARDVRARTRCVVALGDCAVSGNVTALRNLLAPPAGGIAACSGRAEASPALRRAYLEDVAQPGLPTAAVLPRLLDRVLPLHEVIAVDLFLPGCPPPPDLLHDALTALVEGRTPGLEGRLRQG